MRVQFWGTRGSIPAPGPHTVKYGGNTSCVALQTDDGTQIILDCGTGARALGQHLLSSERLPGQPLRLHLFVGHTHWDHIQGFPFFLPAFLPDAEVNVFAPSGFQRNLEESLAGQMQYSYFPVRLQELRSRLHFSELEEGFFRVGNALVETQHLNHTNPTLAYRISADGASVVYSTDHEPFWLHGGLDFSHPGDRRHVEFLEGADLIIHDAQYTESEYPERYGWGHSTWEYATDVAVAAKARTLALFHHDPGREDDAIARFEEEAALRVATYASDLVVIGAQEGMTLDLRGKKTSPNGAHRSALARREITGSRVLVVGGTEAENGSIVRELQDENLICSRAPTKDAALVLARQAPPDLAIIHGQPGTSATLAKQLRQRSGNSQLPVLILTQRPTRDDDGMSLQGATDYVAKPCSPPMLRSRVRAWLARAAEDTGADTQAETALTGAELAAARAGQGPRLQPSRRQLQEAISAIPVFRSLAPEHVDALSGRARMKTYASGQEIIRQDEEPESLFVILSGRVRVLAASEDLDQYELVLAELGAGEVFGEVGTLTDRGRSAMVVAVERTTCLIVPADAFTDVVKEAPRLALELLQVVAERLYDTDRRLARYAPDPLTGLARRRAFYDLYGHVAAQAHRAGIPVALGLLDIVCLKAINDQHGYAAGDEVVRTIADALRESARKSDVIARYGGDEFAVLLVGAREDTMALVAERVHQRLSEIAPTRGIPWPIECSYGVAIAAEPPSSVDQLFLDADIDMQRRKAARLNGRRRRR